MPTPEQTAAISRAITAIRQAEILLTDQIRNACETLMAIKLTHEYNNLDWYLSSLLHLQNATDDEVFEVTTTHIKSTADGLKVDVTTIQTIVQDEQTAGKVIDYITQAAAVVAEL